MSLKRLKKLKRLSPKQDEARIRILYVEDAAVIRDTIARLLEVKGGFEVAHAKNGQEGVKMAIKWKPDLVLMDLRMPVMDGYEAIHQIKSNPRTRHLPVFVLSAWSSKKARTDAQLAGADRFFVKPPDLDSLTHAIEDAVAGK